jgi:ubiquinone/menaquinone biosynthesis C-methylase UbiE
MSYRSAWYIPNHIYWQEISQGMTLDDLQRIKTDADMLIANYAGQNIHSLVDARLIQGLDVSLRQMVDTFGNFAQDRLSGWVIVVGDVNAMIRFTVSVISQMFDFKFRFFSTLPEAIAFLSDQDASLPDLQHVPIPFQQLPALPPSTDHFQRIYSQGQTTAWYDEMVSYEDWQGHLAAFLRGYLPPQGRLLDVGTGTGRVSRLLVGGASHVLACDMNVPMLRIAQAHQVPYQDRWALLGAEISRLPVPDQWADLTVEGWALGHWVDWAGADWQGYMDQALAELARVTRGTLILIETLGTGSAKPAPPTPALATLYRYWEAQHGFKRHELRTDYRFPDVATAQRLGGFFFGEALAKQIEAANSPDLIEWTGLWVR